MQMARLTNVIAGLLVVASTICVVALERTTASIQSTSPATPRPGHERLSVLAGSWEKKDLPAGEKFRDTCAWLAEGRRHMICRQRAESPRGATEQMAIFSYRGADATYLLTTLPQSSALHLNADWAVILPADYWPPNMYKWCSREAPGRGGYWAPDSETIGPLEVALPLALLRALEQEIKDSSRRPAPADYYRQYIGIRIGRRQVVYINGFHKSYVEGLRPPFADYWRTRVVNVCDGGSMFFGAEYDPATRQVTNVRFNGSG